MALQTLKIQQVVNTVQAWSPPEQLELIQAITKLLQGLYNSNGSNQAQATMAQTQPLELVHHAAPITDIRALIADFWPSDESADDINAFVYQQRQEDLARER